MAGNTTNPIFLGGRQGVQEQLTVAITSCMVGGGATFLNTIHTAESLDEVALKIPALV